jgi:transmembrane sensor
MRDSTTPPDNERLSQRVIAEASVWIARISGPHSEAEKKGLRRWLAESKSHQRAFDLATDIWDEAGSLRGCAAAHLVRSNLVRSNPVMTTTRYSRAALAISLACIAVAAAFAVYMHRTGITTAVGEQRLVTLDDGSKILLNTSTRLVVRYDKFARRVDLEKGEALFDVIKNPHRPFVVMAGGREVTALGTSFDVRRDGTQITVTLLEGKVTVAAVSETQDAVVSVPAEVEVLHPGQRLTFAPGRPPLLDRPQIQKVTDWQRGQVSLDNLSLADAVTEMNRYSEVQIRIERPEAAKVRVSGIFRTGDSMSFARAVSQTYGLQPVEQANAILLTGIPEKQTTPDAAAELASPDAGSESP